MMTRQQTIDGLKLRLKLAFIMELDDQVRHYLKELEKYDNEQVDAV